MLSLMDIDRLTKSNVGFVYFNMYKEVNSVRPHGITFRSIEEFNHSYEQLVSRLNSSWTCPGFRPGPAATDPIRDTGAKEADNEPR